MLDHLGPRVPKFYREIDHLVVADLQPLLLQQMLHFLRRVIMVPPCKQAIAIDDPVRGDGRIGMMSADHGPAHHSRGKAGAQTGGDSAIGGDTAFGDLAGDAVDEVKERVLRFAGGFDDWEARIHAGLRLLVGRTGINSFADCHDLLVLLIIETAVVPGPDRN